LSEFIVSSEVAYTRRMFLAVELLDAVTLTRISSGVKVEADGLKSKPVINSGGCYVWLEDDSPTVQKITVDPGRLPYETFELDGADVTQPLTTIQLQPRVGYEFSPGITGLRGTLIESQFGPVEPVQDGEVRLRWLDDLGVWQEAPTESRTEKKSGDFVSVLRLAPKQKPDVDANGKVTVQLHVRRGAETRTSADLKLLQGRVTDPTTSDPLKFAWDEMLP
jgi:hypothetical protein